MSQDHWMMMVMIPCIWIHPAMELRSETVGLSKRSDMMTSFGAGYRLLDAAGRKNIDSLHPDRSVGTCGSHYFRDDFGFPRALRKRLGAMGTSIGSTDKTELSRPVSSMRMFSVNLHKQMAKCSGARGRCAQ